MADAVVVNIRSCPDGWQTDPRYVYVGRAGHGMSGEWGNPHRVGDACPACSRPHTREEAVRVFADEAAARYDVDATYRDRLEFLRGKFLVCFCKPDGCHADVYSVLLRRQTDAALPPPLPAFSSPPPLPIASLPPPLPVAPPPLPLPVATPPPLPVPVDGPRLVAVDTETVRFLPGLAAPPVVVASVYDGSEARVVSASDFPTEAWFVLSSGATWVGANTSYDFLCAMAADESLKWEVFRALREGRVHCVLIAEALHAIARGHLGKMPDGMDLLNGDGKVVKHYNLFNVVGLCLGRWDAKDTAAWRKSYALLADVPMDRWPELARRYVVEDAQNPYEVALAQLGLSDIAEHEWNGIICIHCGIEVMRAGEVACVSRRRKPHDNISNLAFQVEADLCLQLGAAWGLRTDPESIEVLAAEVEVKRLAAIERFQKIGWIRQDGSEDQAAVKRAVALAYGASAKHERCRGTGKVDRWELVKCRGAKERGRYRGCLGSLCPTCSGKGEVSRYKSTVTCKTEGNERGCDGSGFDLEGLPMLRLTETGGISTDRDAKMESGDDDLADYGADEWNKSYTTYLPYLRTGVHRPLAFSPNALVETGRPSYEGSTLLQMPRKGKERECVRARGAWCGSPLEYAFGSSDFQAGELCCLSQLCFYLFKYSRMLEAINAAGEPGILHADLAAQVLGISLPEFLKRLKAKDPQAKDFRQASKPYHFGKPAGMGSPKIVLTNRKKSAGFTVCERGPMRDEEGRPGYSGIRFCVLVQGKKECGTRKVTNWRGNECQPVCEDCASVVEYVLGPAYFRAYPEIKDYHRWVTRQTDTQQPAPTIVWDQEAQAPKIVRLRGGCGFSDFANGGFQSMLAEIGKHALIGVTRECYLGVDEFGAPSPLAGCRVPLFLYDECFTELIANTAHLSGPRVAEIMMASGKALAPHVTWKVDTALSRRWYKNAEAKYDEAGRLVVWEPR